MKFLGIDGGGSKTTFLLEDDTGRCLALYETGPSNWLSSGTDAAWASLASGIGNLPVLPDVVCGGFAGAGRPDGVQFYQNCLASLLPRTQIFVETDALITYVAALGLEPGVLLIAGTGSIALARKSDGTMVRAGGWGPAFGDEGGGFWIGRQAIQRCLKAHDAGDSTDFESAVTSTLGLSDIEQVPLAWKEGTLGVQAVASLVPLILKLYPSEPAGEILRSAAGHLRALFETARRRADLPESCRKAAAGSVALHGVIQQLLRIDLSSLSDSPARGAIALARDRIKGR